MPTVLLELNLDLWVAKGLSDRILDGLSQDHSPLDVRVSGVSARNVPDPHHLESPTPFTSLSPACFPLHLPSELSSENIQSCESRGHHGYTGGGCRRGTCSDRSLVVVTSGQTQPLTPDRTTWILTAPQPLHT